MLNGAATGMTAICRLLPVHFRALRFPPSKWYRDSQEPGPAQEDIVGLLVMILGLVLFLGVHTVTTQRDFRAGSDRFMG